METKAKPHYLSGFWFVPKSEIPGLQWEKLVKGLPKKAIFSLIHEGILIEDCIDYSIYEQWFKRSNLPNSILSPEMQF
jgi:hypothetical protein